MSQIEVVISGIGGRFPRSKNIKEFSDHLLSGNSLLAPATRWTPGCLGTPVLVGETDDPDKFDYTYFGMNPDISKQEDPCTRLAVETALEALIDAGICPSTIKGTNAQVYAGTLISEMKCYDDFCPQRQNAYGIMGKNRSTTANRISYFFHLTGTSSSYDDSAGWLGTGLSMARTAIQTGACDMAFVNGTALMLVPEISRQKQDLGLLSPDGSCHPFDVNANGVARGDAQVTFLVQRADKAKRSYGSIVLAATEPQRNLPNWLLSVNPDCMKEFITSSYRTNGLDPNNVKLLEADGLGIKNMAEAELNVFDEVLNAKRSKSSPLYVGSVKTVTGDAEAVAGQVALTKLILAMETGIISPTLDCGDPNPHIPGLVEGRLKVATKPTEWEVTPDTLVAASSLSTSGLISHVVLRANGKKKNTNIQNNYPLPYLVFISGRNEDFVLKALKKVTSSPFDPEYIRLTHETFALNIDKFEFRGYGFHGPEGSQELVIQQKSRRPVWFMYSGMQSQWPGMGKALMLFPVIKDTFRRLHNILEPKGVDVMDILTTTDPNIFDNVLNSFVGITAIQIALSNLLRQLGIVPDGIIGHSLGEQCCGYADDCLTEEQTILAAYERGMLSINAELIDGLMAAVGLGYAKVKPFLRPDVYVACHNSRESCTITGPTESIKKVMKSLKIRGIFVREVNVGNVAYHSPYIRPAAPIYYEALCKLIKTPKKRSSKWVSTSAPKENWDTDEVRYCSAEYLTNNLLSPVLLEEGSAYIPDNALVIEIAPHGLLLPILKRSLSKDTVLVSLTRRGTDFPTEFLLQAVGKLFLEGLSPKIWHLYPDVQMPVSRNTPSLAPLVEWVHDVEFPLSVCSSEELWGDFVNRDLDFTCPSLEIAGTRYLLPAYALVMTLEVFAEMKRQSLDTLRVRFEDICFYDLLKLDNKDALKVSVNILPVTGEFIVARNETTIVKGKLYSAEKSGFVQIQLPDVESKLEHCLNSDDLYSELKNRCVNVHDNLKSIHKLQTYDKDWIAGVNSAGDLTSLLNSLMTLFQLQSGENDQKPTYVSHIQLLIIDTSQRISMEANTRMYLPTSTLVYPGIAMSQVEFRTVETFSEIHSSALQFIPFGQTDLDDEKQFLSLVVQLTLEKILHRPSIYKIYDAKGEHPSLAWKIQDVLKTEIGIECEHTDVPKNANLLLCAMEYIPSMTSTLKSSNGLLLTRCKSRDRELFNETLRDLGLYIAAESQPTVNSTILVVGNLLPLLQPSDCLVIKMKPQDEISATLNDTETEFVILVWEDGTDHPIDKTLSDVMCTECPEKVRLVVLMTTNAPQFSMSLPLYADQIRRNLPLNIYLDGKWGGYRMVHLPNILNSIPKKRTDLDIRQFVNRNNDDLKIDSSTLRVHRVSGDKKTCKSFQESIGYCVRNSQSQYVIGVGNYDGRSEFFDQDPHLQWTIPQEWSSDDVSSVPVSYAMAYYILFEVARLHPEEKVFITCPLTSVGQAAIRISDSLGCRIVALVASPQEKKQLQSISPKLKRIIVCSSEVFVLDVKKYFPEGVNVIVSDLTGARLKAATLCVMDGFHNISRFLQISQDTMLKREQIGMFMFTTCAQFYGVSDQVLLEASIKIKAKVAKWVQQGLETGVVKVQSSSTNRISNGHDGTANGYNRIQNGYNATANGYNVTMNGLTNEEPKLVHKQGTCSVIVDASKAQWIGLAHSLASRGCKHITLLQRKPSLDLLQRHKEILQRSFGTELIELTTIRSAIDLVNNPKLGAIEAVFVFEQSDFAEEVVQELDSKGLRDAWVVVFDKTPSRFSWKRNHRNRNGLKVRSVLGVEVLPTVTATPLLDWLLSPDAPAVTVLDKNTIMSNRIEMISLTDAWLLPTSAAELQELGSSLRGRTCPTFREIVTRGQKISQNGEVHPLFFIKGIHGTATSELETLAAELLAPMVEVTLHADNSIEATTLAIVQGIQKIHSTGPYNLAGDAIYADIVMKVAYTLERKGFASVVFVINEGTESIRESLKVLQKKNRLGEAILKATLAENLEPQALKRIDWSNLIWEQQVETTLSTISLEAECKRKDITIALNYIRTFIQHFIQTHEKIILYHGVVHTLRKGNEYRVCNKADRCLEHIIPSSKLKIKAIADIISSNMGAPVLQLNLDRA